MSHPEFAIASVADIFKLLGNETRLTMLKILSEHDCCVCELVEVFAMSQPAISQHLRKLKSLEIVNEDKRGQWTFYSLNSASEYFPLIKQMLRFLPEQTDKLEEQRIRGKCDS